MCESQRSSLGDNEVAFCGSKLATLEGDPVMSFSADQEPNEDYPVVSVCDQTFNVDLNMLVSGNQTSYYKMTNGVGKDNFSMRVR